jgi:hypothetical protein
MTFIHETFDNFEKLLNYITNEDKFMKGQIGTNSPEITLKNYLLEIPIR